MVTRTRNGAKPFDILLPTHLGAAFERELKSLVENIHVDEGSVVPSRTSYLLQELFSKYLDDKVVPASTRKASAIAKWLSVESNNAKTNQRLLHMCEEDLGWVKVSRLRDFIRKEIAAILGPVPYDTLFDRGNHTNGASTRVRRGPTAATYKFSGEAHGSSSAMPHWFWAVQTTRLESQTVQYVEESVMFTVPKKSDIDRVACKEPEINMFLQRCVGDHIRRALRLRGIDLNDQTINQRLAKVALATGLATVDLSSASDSVTRQLVLELLPWEWYSLMDDLRVKSVKIPTGDDDFVVHQLEMFSSMGNGFTFELESLLFYAITRAVCWGSGIKGRISVFGDDIIVPSAIVPRLARVLHFLGFKMNPKKTHYNDPIRESCGKHYIHGSDVSPFYVRKPVRTIQDLIRLLNQLYIWDSAGNGFFMTRRAAEFHRKWSAHIPSRLYGGVDPQRVDSLVTGHAPRSVISEPPIFRKGKDGHRRKVPLRADEVGQLNAWLFSKELLIPTHRIRRLNGEPVSDLAVTPLGDPFGDYVVEVTHWKTSKPQLKRVPKWMAPTSDRPYLLFEDLAWPEET